MSGFLFLFHRDGTPAHTQELNSAQALLRHRGPDGYSSDNVDCFAFSHFHFWTTPEDQGEKQPLHDHETGYFLLFDGRLDNRQELITNLNLSMSPATLTDAQLVQQCLLRFGESALSSFVGPFALVWCDLRRRKVLLARDPVGDRTLFFNLTNRVLAVSSEESALLKLAHVKPVPNPARVTAYFAFMAPEPGQSFFQGVSELPPGRSLLVGEADQRENTYWDYADHVRPTEHGDGQAVVREFRHLLTQATQARCRSLLAPGLLLSGGLDSSTIAGLAALTTQRGSSQLPHAYSYIFPNLATCDEATAISQICDFLGLSQTSFDADSLWPAKNWNQWPSNPNGPEDNIFRLLLNRIHQIAASDQRRVLLSGDFGDHHFAGSHYWLWDGLRKKKWQFLRQQSQLNLKMHGFRTSLRRMGFGRKAHLYPAKKPAGYLTPYAKTAWCPAAPPPKLPGITAIRSRALMDPMVSRSFTAEIPFARHSQIDLRHPYRDRRLITFSLGLPGYYLYRNGEKKWLLRQVSKDIFTQKRVRLNLTSNLHPFFLRGLERERSHIRHLLNAHQDLWETWVKPEPAYASLDPGKHPNIPNLLWWQCLTYTRWHQTFA